MASGRINLQANDGKVAGIVFEDGASGDVAVTVPKAGGKLAADSAVVHKTGDETIAGVKTFTSSPIVPTPTTGTQVANKDYADLKVALASFVGTNQSLAMNGYQKLPGGLIIQWGTTLDNNNTVATVSFPIAFPNSCLGVVGSQNGATVQPEAVAFGWSATTLTFRSAGPYSVGIRYLAIGY